MSEPRRSPPRGTPWTSNAAMINSLFTFRLPSDYDAPQLASCGCAAARWRRTSYSNVCLIGEQRCDCRNSNLAQQIRSAASFRLGALNPRHLQLRRKIPCAETGGRRMLSQQSRATSSPRSKVLERPIRTPVSPRLENYWCGCLCVYPAGIGSNLTKQGAVAGGRLRPQSDNRLGGLGWG
jgi:hypothetical protein